MTFVTPALLAGAFLLVIPIVLHLIMRQQPRQVEFPTLRFLKVRRNSNRRRLRLRHWLLLALRAAAICLLALALSRPSIKGSGFLGGEEGPVAAAMIFDTTPRMEYRHNNETRLQVAQATGDWLLTQLPPNSEVAVIDSASMQASFAVDLGAAKQRVERLRVTNLPRSIPAMLESALNLLKESKLERREVYVFTDLAQGAWASENATVLQKKLAELREIGLYVIDVGVEDPQDFALGDIQLSRQTTTPHTPFTLGVELSRFGPEESRGVELFMLDEAGQPRKRGHQIEVWKAGENRQVEFRVGGLELGTHQGYLQIVGEDGLKWDDTRYFTIDVRTPWRVLVAASRPEQALFVTEALAPSVLRDQRQSRFECEFVSWEQLEAQSLSEYAAVWLLDPGALPESVWTSLADYARDGGALGIFLGRHARLDALNAPAPQAVLPGLLKRQWSEPSYLAPTDLNHPLLAKFRPLAGNVPWRAFPVFRFWQFGELAPQASQVIAYGNGQPALIEQPLGRGRVLTMTTPVSDEAGTRRDPWNMLPTGLEPWPFVMLTTETALYMVGSGDERLNYLAGETAIVQVGRSAGNTLVSLATPSGDHIRQTVDPRTGSLAFTATDDPGNYRLRAGGAGEGLDRGFSVNIAPQLSQLNRISPGELTALLGENRFRLARNRDEIDRDVNVGRVGRELFPYVMLLLALVLGCEQVLANRFYRRGAS